MICVCLTLAPVFLWNSPQATQHHCSLPCSTITSWYPQVDVTTTLAARILFWSCSAQQQASNALCSPCVPLHVGDSTGRGPAYWRKGLRWRLGCERLSDRRLKAAKSLALAMRRKRLPAATILCMKPVIAWRARVRPCRRKARSAGRCLHTTLELCLLIGSKLQIERNSGFAKSRLQVYMSYCHWW